MQDRAGQRFGKLVVVRDLGRDARLGRRYLCQCDCGTKKSVLESNLLGMTRSCGCARSKRDTRGLSRTQPKEYQAWAHMLARCSDPKRPDFHNYGGRGIEVCERWRTSFFYFFTDMGPRPSIRHTLDRIDNSKGYEPGNVRWAVWEVQQNNRRNNVLVEWNGERKTFPQWSRETGIHATLLRARLKLGWPVQLAMTVKPKAGNRLARILPR